MKNLFRWFIFSCILLCLPQSINALNTRRTFDVVNASDGLADNSAQTILSLPSGRMVTTTMGYINIYDGIKFTHINTDKGDFYALPNYTGNYHLYLDNAMRLWLKNKQTVTCVDLMTEQCVADINGIFRAEGLDKAVVDLFVDSDGCLWMMSDGSFYGSGKKLPIPIIDAMQLQDMDVVGDSLFTFYSTGEVVCHDIPTAREIFRTHPYDATKVDSYSRTSVIKRIGVDIVQIRNGVKGSILMKLDTRTRQWTIIKELDHKLNNIAEYKGLLYIPSAYGYWTYNMRTGEMEHYDYLTMLDGHTLVTDINVMAFDYQGGMWLGTESRGLLYSKPLTSPFKVVPWRHETMMAEHYASMMDTVKLPDLTAFGKNVNCVYKDSRQWTWIGTPTGIEMRRTEKADPLFITKKQGLKNEVVHSIVEDNNGHIWVSTSHGISCVVVRGDSVRFVNSYIEDDNIPSETFRNSRMMKDKDGIIAMQAIENMVIFDPSHFVALDTPICNLSPTLISIAVNGRDLEVGEDIEEGKAVLDRAASQLRYIQLAHDQNTVVLTFSAVNYFRPVQTYYRVRIPGIMNEWKVCSVFETEEFVNEQGTLRLPLVGLKPGVYKVEVEASMVPYMWDGKPLSVTIEIKEPWWKKGSLYLLFIVVVVTFIGMNIYYYNRNYRLQMRRNSDEWDLLKRLRSYANRCESYNSEELLPRPEDVSGMSLENAIDLDERFVDLMVKITPVLKQEKVSVKELCQKSGLNIKDFYQLVNANLHKNPRMLSCAMRLDIARRMLQDAKYSISEIAYECNFSSTNFFIASFYGRYRITPKDYRETCL